MILSRYSASRLSALLTLLAISMVGMEGAKPPADPNTPEGRLMGKIQAEGDLSKKITLLELFPELFPGSLSTEYVWSELQAGYLHIGKLERALAAGSNALVFNQNNLDVACLNWRIAADMKESALVATWMTQAGNIADRAFKNPDPEMSKTARECGTSARQAVEFEQYRAAVTAKNPADRVKLLEEFLKNHPQTQHAGDIEITLFLAYREQGDASKALAAAERLVSHNDTREDAMLVVAESYFKAGKDFTTVLSLSKRAIERLNNAPKPDGVTVSDWARTKTVELTQANYMIGSVNFQAEKWDAADQAFRAALPGITDPRFKAEVLNSLGWANYKLKNVADSIKFYMDCTNIPGPLQQASAKTLNTITAEYRIK